MTTLTFKPLKGNRYRCNQTGAVMTKSQILSYLAAYLAGNTIMKVKRVASTPVTKKKGASSHPSKYRAKHR